MLAATAANPSCNFSREIVNRITAPLWGVCAKSAWLLIYAVREWKSVAVVVTVDLWESSASQCADISWQKWSQCGLNVDYARTPLSARRLRFLVVLSTENRNGFGEIVYAVQAELWIKCAEPAR